MEGAFDAVPQGTAREIVSSEMEARESTLSCANLDDPRGVADAEMRQRPSINPDHMLDGWA